MIDRRSFVAAVGAGTLGGVGLLTSGDEPSDTETVFVDATVQPSVFGCFEQSSRTVTTGDRFKSTLVVTNRTGEARYFEGDVRFLGGEDNPGLLGELVGSISITVPATDSTEVFISTNAPSEPGSWTLSLWMDGCDGDLVTQTVEVTADGC